MRLLFRRGIIDIVPLADLRTMAKAVRYVSSLRIDISFLL
jgi:hypothetical protein